MLPHFPWGRVPWSTGDSYRRDSQRRPLDVRWQPLLGSDGEAIMNESQRPLRLLVVGLGSADRGDDAVGPIVAKRFAGLRVPGIRVLEREDPTSLIELWDPEDGRADLAIVVDAVRSHEVPGTLTIMETGSQLNPLPADAWARTGRGGDRRRQRGALLEGRGLDAHQHHPPGQP